jgi:hypothetical protein
VPAFGLQTAFESALTHRPRGKALRLVLADCGGRTAASIASILVMQGADRYAPAMIDFRLLLTGDEGGEGLRGAVLADET